MKKNFLCLLFAVFLTVFWLTACSTPKTYEMSYEQVISLLENQSKEMMEMFFNIDAQQKDINLSSKVDVDDVDFDVNLQMQSKIDYDSKVQDIDMSFDADVKVPESELNFNTSWALEYSLIWDNMYLKLSKFSLGWPSAKNLAMITMIVNSFKWQRFKLGMSGMSMSHTFDLYDLYSEKLWDIVDNVWKMMINQGSGIYDWIFDEYKWYNAWKYSVDEEKFDEMLHMYVDIMNEFYSWLLAQYSQNLWTQDVDLLDFNKVFSGITYDNLEWYFVIVWKNEVVETMEGAHMNIDWTWVVANYYYGKDWLYFEAKTEDWDDLMLIVAKRNGKTYDVYANMMSVLSIKWSVKFNKFSKKDWIDANFDLKFALKVDSETLDDFEGSENINMEMPLKWDYKVRNIDKFSLQEPSDAVDLLEMFGNYLWEISEDSQNDVVLDEDLSSPVEIQVETE